MTIRQQDVVCAFILPIGYNSDLEGDDLDTEGFKLLCAQRPDDADYFPSMYEFVGGKVDEGESHHHALIREVQEELDVRIEVIGKEPAFTFSHPQKLDKKRGDQVVFRLYFYWTQLMPSIDGTAPMPKALASQKVEWLTPYQMKQLKFCSGDEDIILALGQGTLRPGISKMK